MYINQLARDFPRNPAEVFDLFLDDDAINLLTNETINYASQKGNHQFSLTSGEMRAFIGILLLFGYCIVPRCRLYWATESNTYNEMVATTMLRNRFEEIMRFLHGANNANLLIEDTFAKVRPIFEHPEQKLSCIRPRVWTNRCINR